jgi:hypothetical protein
MLTTVTGVFFWDKCYTVVQRLLLLLVRKKQPCVSLDKISGSTSSNLFYGVEGVDLYYSDRLIEDEMRTRLSPEDTRKVQEWIEIFRIKYPTLLSSGTEFSLDLYDIMHKEWNENNRLEFPDRIVIRFNHLLLSLIDNQNCLFLDNKKPLSIVSGAKVNITIP